MNKIKRSSIPTKGPKSKLIYVDSLCLHVYACVRVNLVNKEIHVDLERDVSTIHVFCNGTLPVGVAMILQSSSEETINIKEGEAPNIK